MSSRRPRDDRRGGGERRPSPRGSGGDQHVVAGERAVAELLDAAAARVKKLLVDPKRSGSELVARARALGVAIVEADLRTLEQASPDGPTKGIVAIASPPREHELDELVAAALARPRGRLVALDGVEDPHNLGAILRSAEFFGAAGVFWPRDGGAPLTAAAVRASAGASERLPSGRVTNLARALGECKDAGLWVVGTVPEGGMPLAQAVAEDRLPEHLVVVLGGEHDGLRRLTRERCDYLVTIERTGAIASLNVSAAAAVVLAALR